MKDQFKTLKDVSRFLISEAWAVSERTVYRHGKAGKIQPDIGKEYSLKAVRRYASRFLMQAATRQKINNGNLAKRKQLAEINRIEELGRLAKLKRMAEEDKYILKSDLYLEMASRAAALEAGLKYMINAKAPAWIEMLDGNQKKIGELILTMEGDLNEALNEFASTKEFTIIFEAGNV